MFTVLLDPTFDSPAWHVFSDISVWLMAVINPFIYFFSNQKYKELFNLTFTKKGQMPQEQASVNFDLSVISPVQSVENHLN